MNSDQKVIRLHEAEMPALGLGTWQLKGDECAWAVQRGLEIGYRHIDTAQMYGNEEQVGKALNMRVAPRSKVWLTTKITPENLGSDDVISSTEASLKRLQTDYVDLLLIHWPNPEMPLEETLSAMNKLVEQGKAHHIGVSNFTVDLTNQACELSDAPIFANQVEYHPYLSQRKLLDCCRGNDVVLTAYSPLARGEVPGDGALKEIGQNYGKTASQVALRWLMQQELVSAVPKSSTDEHLKADFNIWDFDLTDEDMKQIHGLARGERLIDPSFAPDWD